MYYDDLIYDDTRGLSTVALSIRGRGEVACPMESADATTGFCNKIERVKSFVDVFLSYFRIFIIKPYGQLDLIINSDCEALVQIKRLSQQFV